MNPETHARISVARCGGCVDDYYPLHAFLDSTKELCSDNRHRVLHTLWGVRRVVIPIFGATIVNGDGRKVDVKDLCERDHILPDYGKRFIPTLSDFVRAIEPDDLPDWKARVERIHAQFTGDAALRELLLSPLAQTGTLASLLLTHNSWFLTEIVPKIRGSIPDVAATDIAPSDFFDRMRFELWMDNGADLPPSARRACERLAG
jgi:hypothetical protein